MDSFRGDLSYSLPLLVGFDLVEVDHGGRLFAMGGVGPLVIVEGNPSANAGLRLRAVSDPVRSPFTASSATRALNLASWFLRFDMF
ncbi:hypothetical protein [Thioclava nitratireducens]|uniref:hypothetical protein n=1 Tax=Thioclava nitratireducens TaxID=1915078 RepID=UPI0024810C9D|nr:hypothetical protein [Thioclava nitratireducens]WGT51425.1 hypothetical protein P0N61_05175 [Thioclava nitratireducens]